MSAPEHDRVTSAVTLADPAAVSKAVPNPGSTDGINRELSKRLTPRRSVDYQIHHGVVRLFHEDIGSSAIRSSKVMCCPFEPVVMPRYRSNV